jgi:hypothetical protein
MVNKKIWLGILALALVFGTILMVSCFEDEDRAADIVVKNEREQRISVRIPAVGYSYDVSITDVDEYFFIDKGDSKTYKITWPYKGSGTQCQIFVYINDVSNLVNANDGKTTTVTAKDDDTISIVE